MEKTEFRDPKAPDPKLVAIAQTLAFPCQLGPVQASGLTQRELYAAMAMQGMLSGMNVSANGSDFINCSAIALDAIEMADTLIKELNKDAPK